LGNYNGRFDFETITRKEINEEKINNLISRINDLANITFKWRKYKISR